jgi:hypothetical protein
MPAASGAWSQAECDPGNHEPWGRGALASRRPGWRRGELASCYERAAFGTDGHDVIRLGSAVKPL